MQEDADASREDMLLRECDRARAAATLTSDVSAVYVYTLGFTLKRVSWIVRDLGEPVIVTFANVQRFR